MRLLNRAAIMVKPKRLFIDWANSLDDGPKLDRDRMVEYTVYLIDDVSEYMYDVEAFVHPYYRAIFDHELAAWHRRREDWPTGRDFALFLDWFDVEVHSMVLDLSDDVLRTEHFEGY